MKGVIIDVEDLKEIIEMCWTTIGENRSDGGVGLSWRFLVRLRPSFFEDSTGGGIQSQAFNNNPSINCSTVTDDVPMKSTLTTLIIKNCLVCFVGSVLPFSSPKSSTASITQLSPSPFVSLKALSIDLGVTEYSYAKALDALLPNELDAIDWELGFGVGRFLCGRFGRRG